MKNALQSPQKGQALLVIVLVMVVALTIALSVATRSITNLRSSVEEESTQRALSAAEAGVEQALIKNAPIPQTTFSDNHASYKAEVTAVDGTTFSMNGGDDIQQDDGQDIWLVPHDGPGNTPNYAPSWPTDGSTGKLRLYWGSDTSPTGCSDAALEVIVVSGNTINPTVTHWNFDPCNPRNGVTGNAFENGDNGTGGTRFSTMKHRTGVISVSQGFFIRVVPLYAKAKIGVIIEAGGALPSQGNSITSTGEANNTKRKIAIFKAYPKVPQEFFHLIFQPSN
jgi:hypothetical protein